MAHNSQQFLEMSSGKRKIKKNNRWPFSVIFDPEMPVCDTGSYIEKLFRFTSRLSPFFLMVARLLLIHDLAFRNLLQCGNMIINNFINLQ